MSDADGKRDEAESASTRAMIEVDAETIPRDETVTKLRPPDAAPLGGSEARDAPAGGGLIFRPVSEDAATEDIVVDPAGNRGETSNGDRRYAAESTVTSDLPEKMPQIALETTALETGEEGQAATRAIWRSAGLAAILWLAAVLAFCIGFLEIPFDDAERAARILDDVSGRSAVMILAAAFGPLALIWMGALVASRAQQLRAEARRMTASALRLAEGANRPAPSLSEIIDAAPNRINNEVEHATRAIVALRGQMGLIATTFTEQAAAIDEAGVRADGRARDIREGMTREIAALSAERKALKATAETLRGETARAAKEIAEAVAGKADGEPRNTGDSEAVLRLETAARDIRSALDEFSAQALTHAHAVAETETAAETAIKERAYRENALEAELKTEFAGMVSQAKAEILEAAQTVSDAAARAAQPIVQSALHTAAPTAMRRNATRADQLDGLRRQLNKLRGHGHQPIAPRKPSDAPFAAGKPAPDLFDAPTGKLDWSKLVSAANFPEGERDYETLDALYAVLSDPQAAQLLQAAEDVLSGLAEEELYMEDLTPNLASTAEWRLYVEGARGEDVRNIGGIEEPRALARTIARLARNQRFRDSTGRFLDLYDAMLTRMLNDSGDGQLAIELANARTGRAFMLLARASRRID